MYIVIDVEGGVVQEVYVKPSQIQAINLAKKIAETINPEDDVVEVYEIEKDNDKAVWVWGSQFDT